MDRLQKTQKNISNKKSLNRGSKGTLQSCPSSVRRFLVTNNHEIYLKRKEYYRQRYLKNKERFAKLQREYHKKNKIIISEKRKVYREKNKEREKLYKKEYRIKNKEILREKNRIYAINNRDKIRERQIKNRPKTNLYHREKYKNDINYKLSVLLRRRLNSNIKGNFKMSSFLKILGCSIPELKQYLEKQFIKGMDWSNWGLLDKNKKTWQIDHIVPLSSFNLQDPKELSKACHYTNLQPLWSIDNRIKSNKIL